MYNRLHTILACDRQTDGQTDILPGHSSHYAYAVPNMHAVISAMFRLLTTYEFNFLSLCLYICVHFNGDTAVMTY